MKIKPYIDKLYASKEYKNFQKEHSDAYVAAGFFVLDLESGSNIHQIDFYVPKEKKVAAFTLDHGITMQMLSLMHSKKPEKLEMQAKIDLEALKGILEDEMKNRNITEEIKKIIAVLQTIDGKRIWNVNCVLSGMGILRAHVEDESKSVLKMEKASILDYIKRISPQQLQQMSQAMPQMQQPQAQVQAQGQMPTQEAQEAPESQEVQQINETPEQKLKQLEELEKAIAKEKEQLKGQKVFKKEKSQVLKEEGKQKEAKGNSKKGKDKI